MTRAKKTRTKLHGGKPERGQGSRSAAPRERLAAQTRKLLGKHYANKYRTGRS